MRLNSLSSFDTAPRADFKQESPKDALDHIETDPWNSLLSLVSREKRSIELDRRVAEAVAPMFNRSP